MSRLERAQAFNQTALPSHSSNRAVRKALWSGGMTDLLVVPMARGGVRVPIGRWKSPEKWAEVFDIVGLFVILLNRWRGVSVMYTKVN